MSGADDEAAPNDRHLGTVVSGRYRVVERLGAGGMGVVYRAEHVHMKNLVALKILHPHMTTVPEVVTRFEREAVAAARIEHANVAAARDFGRLDDGSFYLALEYVEGKSLASLLSRGALPEARALVIARQIADALAAAHAAGIVHRDLKPDNVMLVERDSFPDWVKILDFGIAKVPVEDGGKTLTQIGTIFGTPQYMSPEQGQGQPVDARSDLYALGVMLFEMLAGRLPFVADDMVVLITQHITEPPPPLPGVNPKIADLTFALLEKDPAERIQTASELVSQIDRLLADRSIIPQGSVPPPAVYTTAPPPHDAGLMPTALGVTAPGVVAPALRQKLRRLWSRTERSLPWLLPWVRRLERPVRIRGHRVPLYAFVALGAVFFLVALSMTGGSDAKRSVNGKGEGAGARTPAAPARESEEQKQARRLERALHGDQAALSELGALPEKERNRGVWRALAHGHCVKGELGACIAHYKSGILSSPSLKDDALLVADVRRVAADPVAYEDAQRLSAHHLGARGIDVLWDTWLSTRGDEKASRVHRRARQFLDDSSVRRNASPELLLVLELERAEKRRRCRELKALLPKVAEYGDARALPVLDRLKTNRGCGVFSLGDCWGCLRGTPELAAAKAAAEKRPAPSLVSDPQ